MRSLSRRKEHAGLRGDALQDWRKAERMVPLSDTS
jgi:hypothetical protein